MQNILLAAGVRKVMQFVTDALIDVLSNAKLHLNNAQLLLNIFMQTIFRFFFFHSPYSDAHIFIRFVCPVDLLTCIMIRNILRNDQLSIFH